MMTRDVEFKPIPKLATTWQVSADKLDYTFYLRDDVYWHDGEKLTADDVIFTLDRITDPDTETTWRTYFELLDYENIPYEKIDEYTVSLHLSQTYATFMSISLFFQIQPQHIYLHSDNNCRDPETGVYTFNTDPANRNPVGTGPMIFEEWVVDDHITVIRNSQDNNGPGYWKGHNSYLDRYILKIIPSVQTQLLALQNGQIHVMDLSSLTQDDIEALDSNPEINVYTAPSYDYDYLSLQCNPGRGYLWGSTSRDFSTDPNRLATFKWQVEDFGYEQIGAYVDDEDEIWRVSHGYLVRKALNYGLNKEGLIDYAYPFGKRQFSNVYAAQAEWYNDKVEPYTYDLEKANQLLEEAGYGESPDDPRRELLDFSAIYNSGNLRRQKTLEFARDQWANLGVTITIEQLEWGSFLANYVRPGNYDVVCLGWSGGGGDPDMTQLWSSRSIEPGSWPVDIGADGFWIWEGVREGYGSNDVSYWNPAADLMIDQARTETEKVVRKSYYDQLQTMIVDDCPYIFLLSKGSMTAISADFHGFTDGSISGLWAEPVGFTNIYYEPIESDGTTTDPTETQTSTTTGNTTAAPGFEFFFLIMGMAGISILLKKHK
jgi:peptide/nickel transport system substrate-binding protein